MPCIQNIKDSIAFVLADVRAKAPLVYHITNYVTVNDCANAVLAIGASPVMAPCVQEAADMAAIASSVLLNMGTPDEGALAAMVAAAHAANSRNIPVVFDPVGVAATPFRARLASALLAEARVSVIRGNLSELSFLCGKTSAMRGVDTAESTCNPAYVARDVAQKYHCVAAITGAVDYVSDGETVLTLHNGHPMLARVTGTGCMASSLCAACAGAAPDKLLLAASTGISLMSISGEIARHAMQKGQGTGTFHVALLDSLSLLTPGDVRQFLNVQQLF